ncbi:MAG TPA: chlorite dismutase family protein [Gemmatimonadaceae bacterium]
MTVSESAAQTGSGHASPTQTGESNAGHSQAAQTNAGERPQGQGAQAHPPETLEGWYVLHQIFSVDSNVLAPRVESTRLPSATNGWSAVAQLIGSRAHVMALHFRPTLDELGDAQREFAALPITKSLRLEYSFLSVTEAGLYHLTAQLARDAHDRGGKVGDETYTAEVARRSAVERASAHVQRRLYPPLPDGMPYVCFYPMNKRRDAGQNWYTLTLDERSRLMQTHGLTGRRYAGRVVQVISGAIGLDAWEWGVTLFAKDPLDFKKLVTDMRFDEVSAKYAEFGDFYVGKLLSPNELGALVGAEGETK